MHSGIASAAVVKEILQSETARSEGHFAPWHVFFCKQLNLDAFRRGLKISTFHLSQEDQIDLMFMQKVIDSVQSQEFYLSACFFEYFSNGAFFHPFFRFQKATGQVPKICSGLYAPARDEHLVFPYWQAAYNHAWIFVVDGVALVADITGQMIAFWNAKCRFGGATMRTVIQENAF